MKRVLDHTTHDALYAPTANALLLLRRRCENFVIDVGLFLERTVGLLMAPSRASVGLLPGHPLGKALHDFIEFRGLFYGKEREGDQRGAMRWGWGITLYTGTAAPPTVENL